jgi:hypothetical protein
MSRWFYALLVFSFAYASAVLSQTPQTQQPRICERL